MLDAARLSEAPVVASHSSMHALMPHPRNLDDEQLLALADNGGVVQTVALGAFLSETAARRAVEYRNIRGAFGMIPGQQPEDLGAEPYEDYIGRMEALDARYPDATVADFVDHIDHAVNLIGIDHVGISSDFDGGGGIHGWNDASETLNVTIELVRRGYSEEHIGKLWGGQSPAHMGRGRSGRRTALPVTQRRCSARACRARVCPRRRARRASPREPRTRCRGPSIRTCARDGCPPLPAGRPACFSTTTAR